MEPHDIMMMAELLEQRRLCARNNDDDSEQSEERRANLRQRGESQRRLGGDGRIASETSGDRHRKRAQSTDAAETELRII